MGKINDNETVAQRPTQYLRVMHHIGGHAGAGATDDMIRGGEDYLALLNDEQLNTMHRGGTDIQRLIDLGSLRMATPEEVNKWEVANGLAQPTEAATFAPTEAVPGDLEPENGADPKEPAVPSGGHTSYKGMTKGELSEYNVPELKAMAKEEGVEGYGEMLKPALLDALLALGK